MSRGGVRKLRLASPALPKRPIFAPWQAGARCIRRYLLRAMAAISSLVACHAWRFGGAGGSFHPLSAEQVRSTRVCRGVCPSRPHSADVRCPRWPLAQSPPPVPYPQLVSPSASPIALDFPARSARSPAAPAPSTRHAAALLRWPRDKLCAAFGPAIESALDGDLSRGTLRSACGGDQTGFRVGDLGFASDAAQRWRSSAIGRKPLVERLRPQFAAKPRPDGAAR